MTSMYKICSTISLPTVGGFLAITTLWKNAAAFLYLLRGAVHINIYIYICVCAYVRISKKYIIIYHIHTSHRAGDIIMLKIKTGLQADLLMSFNAPQLV